MNRIVRGTVDGAELVHWLAQDVHHAAKSGAANGHGDALTQVLRRHATHHAFDGFHSDGAHAAFAQVLLHFGGDVKRFGNVKYFAGDANGVGNWGQVTRFKLNVQDGPDALHDTSDTFALFRHAFS